MSEKIEASAERLANETELLSALKQARHVLLGLCGYDPDIFADMDRAISDAEGQAAVGERVAKGGARIAPDLTDDMVVRAMAQIPGLDHDDMVRALQAALGLEVDQ